MITKPDIIKGLECACYSLPHGQPSSFSILKASHLALILRAIFVTQSSHLHTGLSPHYSGRFLRVPFLDTFILELSFQHMMHFGKIHLNYSTTCSTLSQKAALELEVNGRTWEFT